MGFTVETGISAAAVFVQGLLSFFSPCVLPLVPLYLSYLAGGLNLAAESEKNQSGVMPGISEKRGKGGKRLRLFLRVLCFTVGISGAFFVLGLGASAAGSFFREQRMLFARRYPHYSVRRVSDRRVRQFQIIGKRTPNSASAGKNDYVTGDCSDYGIYIQFCLDALCGTRSDQCAADGGKCADKFQRFSVDRCVYSGIHPSVSGSRNLYGAAAGLFPETYESGSLYGENRRRNHDCHGSSDVYGKDE